MDGPSPGRIVVLNGAPRSGKSSIAKALQASAEGVWVSLGVDSMMQSLPERYLPGPGLRPGGEAPELEPLVVAMYTALYATLAAYSARGIHTVADVGHHDMYSRPLHILPQCARLVAELPALLVGVHCPLDAILKRRADTGYPARLPDGTIPRPILLWQEAVHRPGIYDLALDTARLTPEQCAVQILAHIHAGTPPKAFAALSASPNSPT